MSAATKARPQSKRAVDYITLGAAANAVMYGGTAGASNASGYGVPVTATTGLIVWGKVRSTVDNTGGANGAKNVVIDLGREIEVWLFANDTGTAITRADIGTSPYWLDNQTVTGDSTGHSQGGTVYEVTSEGVWVFF